MGKCLFLLAVSPNVDFYKNYLQRPHTLKLTMPMWELEEMLALRNVLFPWITDAQFERLFAIFGGVPRQVLELSGKAEEQLALLNAAIESAASDLPTILGGKRLAGSSISDLVLGYRVLFLNGSYSFHRCRRYLPDAAYGHRDHAQG